ncbi:MAG: hypothetical protein DI539_07885 [Flavobacterium psychrophilum]|nr:MAG: hypothetical protein DI539_07885 [Flavobacterium psychrophilum]
MSLLLLAAVFSFNIGHAQKLKVNKKIDVQQTKIHIGEYEDYNFYSCYDAVKGDTVFVNASRFEEFGYKVKIAFANKEVLPKVYFTDYASKEIPINDSIIEILDSSVIKELKIKHYTLEVNKKSFKHGDTLKLKFEIILDENLSHHPKTIRGEIFHFLNGEVVYWNNGRFYTDATLNKLLEKKK